jgi:O-antigen biosynthesis protein WbqP
MKRGFDFLLALVGVLIFLLPLIIVAVVVRLTSPGPILYWSDRVGRDNQLFKMPKFRSMKIWYPGSRNPFAEQSRCRLSHTGGRFPEEKQPR